MEDFYGYSLNEINDSNDSNDPNDLKEIYRAKIFRISSIISGFLSKESRKKFPFDIQNPDIFISLYHKDIDEIFEKELAEYFIFGGIPQKIKYLKASMKWAEFSPIENKKFPKNEKNERK